ncbi:MAG: hypothetical protein ACKVU1_13155 [bacterium]
MKEAFSRSSLRHVRRLIAAAFLIVGCGDEDNPLAVVDHARPSVVADLAVIATSRESITLAWTAPGDDGPVGTAAAYDVRYSNSPITVARWDSITQFDGEPAPRASGQAETLRIEDLERDMTYYFVLRSRDEASNWSDRSDVVSARTTIAPNVLPPARITDLGATASTASSIVLTWTAPGDDGAVGTAGLYDLRYSTTPIDGGSWYFATLVIGEPSPKPAGASEMFEVASLSDAINYYFAIRTLDTGGLSSAISNVASATTKPDTTPPARVDDLAAAVESPARVALTWTAPGDDSLAGNAFQYDIRYSTMPIDEVSWDTASRVDTSFTPALRGTSENIVVHGLENDSTYYFALRAADNAANVSAISNVASAGPLIDNVSPAAVTDLRGGPTGGATAHIEWTATGDDGCDGRAAAYDIRFSSTPVTEDNWLDAGTIATSLKPDPCGAAQSLTFDFPSDTASYFVAIRVVDEREQLSPISNVLLLELAPTQGDNHWHIGLSLPLRPREYGWIAGVESYAGSIVIAGLFPTIDGVATNSVAQWTGGQWRPLGSGFPQRELALGPGQLSETSLYQGQVVVGGAILQTGRHGSYVTDRIHAAWDGTAWRELVAPRGISSAVGAVFASGPALYYAGSWTEGDWESPTGVNYVARLSDGGRDQLGTPNGGVWVIVEHQGTITIGGAFTRVDSVPTNHIAGWDGSEWRTMGSGLDGTVRALASDGSRLIAGGDFLTASGVVVNRIAEWDGASWQPLGEGLGDAMGGWVSCLAFHEGQLFAAGNIPEWESRGIRNIARWDGAQWRGLGSGTNRAVDDMLSYEGVLYVAGAFDSAGAKPANLIATWEE